jgi:hypothetical protein
MIEAVLAEYRDFFRRKRCFGGSGSSTRVNSEAHAAEALVFNGLCSTDRKAGCVESLSRRLSGTGVRRNLGVLRKNHRFQRRVMA